MPHCLTCGDWTRDSAICDPCSYADPEPSDEPTISVLTEEECWKKWADELEPKDVGGGRYRVAA